MIRSRVATGLDMRSYAAGLAMRTPGSLRARWFLRRQADIGVEAAVDLLAAYTDLVQERSELTPPLRVHPSKPIWSWGPPGPQDLVGPGSRQARGPNGRSSLVMQLAVRIGPNRCTP